MTSYGTWGKTGKEGGTTKYAQALTDFKNTKAQALNTLGGASSNYSTAMQQYSGAQEDMHRELQNAEEAFELANKEIGVGLSQGGEQIAESQEGLASDVEAFQAKSGFAATGKAEKIKSDARKTAGTAWDALGETAGLELEKTQEAYENIVGAVENDPDTLDVDESIGSSAATFEDAGIVAQGKLEDYNTALQAYENVMSTAKSDLENELGIITTDLGTVRDATQRSILDAQTAFKANTSDIYGTLGGEDAEHYAPTPNEIIDLGMGLLGTYLGASDNTSWDYLDDTSEAWSWRKTSSGGEISESSVQGDIGDADDEDESWLWDFGISACLHGDVKVLMGGK